MPPDHNDKTYGIGKVSEDTGVLPHLLRQWEKRFPQLHPRRSSSGERRYTQRDIDIIRRIKTLLKHEGMTSQGIRLQLSRELSEVGHPKNKQDVLFMLDNIANEARAILTLFDPEEEEE